MLEICLLGELQVRRDGTVLPLPASKKSRALLAYLTATTRPHLRERLCELLWDGPDDPRAALRWSLTKLRPLTGTHLVAGREHVELKTEGVRVDLAALCDPANATLETLEATAALYRGQFIDGLDLPSCFRFQQWCNGERERLRQTHVAILTALSRRSTAPEKALTYARQRVAIDPFSDDAHATLIRMLAATDHAHDAMQHYEQCRGMFERELGSRPAASIEDARRSIGRGTAPSPPRKEPAVIEGHDAFMVGRHKELREAARIAADSMSASNDQIIYVTGEPGIGKSRFLDEVCSLMRAQGGMVMRARAFAAEMIRPYGIWTDALRNVTDLPAIASSESDRARLFDAVVDVLHRACASGAVIALDDLQWIDEGSAALLHYVARNVEGKSILIACAARPGEIADNLPAARLLRDLRRDKRVFDIPLGPLSGGEARELAQAISPDDADRVAEQSGGNPLFVIELARTQRGTSLAETMSARLAELEGPARELVGWAAAVGRQFDAEIVGRATGMPAGEMLSALDKLERCAIIRAAGERSYDFTHDLLRDAAYRLISGPRRTLAHRQIARAFQSVHDPDAALAGDVFHHAVLGGDDEMAAGAAVDAGRRCLRFFAYVEAVAIARRGLQAAQSFQEPARLGIQMKLMSVIVMARRPINERLPLTADLAGMVERAGIAGMAKTAALGAHLIAVLNEEASDYRRAADFSIRSAELSRGADRTTAAYSIANTARCLLFLQREVPKAEALLAEAQAIGIDCAELALGWGYLHAHQGRGEEARPHFEHAIELAHRDRDHWREWVAVARLTTIALEEGRPDIALRECERLGPLATKMKGGSEPARTAMLSALSHYLAGEEADLDTPLAGLRAIDSKSDLAWALAFLAEIEAGQGYRDAARAHAAEALEAAEIVGRDSDAAIARAILGRHAGTPNTNDLTARAQKFIKEKDHGHPRTGADV